jgi:hypothetical protein
LKDRTDEEKNLALGSVVYETLLLGLGMQLYRERNRFPKLKFAQWSREGQIALELCLMRCRSLEEFLSGRSNYKDDIQINQIDPVYDRSECRVDSVNHDFITAIHKRSAHLTWKRATADLETFQEMNFEESCLIVFKEAYCFIGLQITKGDYAFVEPRHTNYWQELQLLHEDLFRGQEK